MLERQLGVARYELETPVPCVKPAGLYVNRAADVAAICAAMGRYRQEVFRVLLLDQRNRVVRKVTVSKGTLGSTTVHPRDVFREAIRTNAASVILVHNHPSADTEPSADDIEITKRLVSVGELVGIAVLDHVIVVSKGGYYSLKEHGQM